MADGFRVVDGVVGHADFEPPIAAAHFLGQAALLVEIRGILVLDGPLRGFERHRAPHVTTQEMDGVSHGIRARLLRRVGFIELVTPLGTHAPFATGGIGHDAIASAIDEGFPLDAELGLRVLDDRDHGGNAAFVMHLHAADIGVEVECETRGADGDVVEHHVPDAVGPAVFVNLRMIGGALLDERLGDDAGLAGVGMESRGAMGRDTDLR